MNSPKQARSVFITGASGGIGEALALEFARRGYAVAIAARRLDRLQALETRLVALGAASVFAVELDVDDLASIPGALERAAQALGRLDIVVANAGIGPGTPIGRGRFEQARQTIMTNVLGAMATIDAGVALLRAQGGGQIVGITSVAAGRGLATFGAYSASKAAMHRYLQALRIEVHHEPIVVTELAPGFIDTDLNRGMTSRPFVIPVATGAAIMARMIERQAGFRFVPAFPWVFVVPLMKLLPTALLAPRPRRARDSSAGGPQARS
jgi:NAD(P)-dependent dehydrogenase (short-subunit alcohol dehydrogenase family)